MSRGEVVVVGRVGIAEAVEPLDGRPVGEFAVLVAGLRKLHAFEQVDGVARIEEDGRIVALVFGRTDLVAGPWRLRRKMHHRTRIVVRQPVVDGQRAPVGRGSGILDADGEGTQPVGTLVIADLRTGLLDQREVAVRGRHVARRREPGRDVAIAAFALLPDVDGADMALVLGLVVGGVAVVVGEVGVGRRIVLRPHQSAVIALQAMDLGGRIERRIHRRIVAKRVARRPQIAAAGAADLLCLGIVAIAERDAARGVVAFRREADGIAVGSFHPGARRRRIIRHFVRIADDGRRLGFGEHGIIVTADL